MFTNKPKIFCVGYNKTGTTTLERVLRDFGYKIGNQPKGELLIKSYLKSDFKPIIKFSKTADVFQDIPFSLPFTWLILREHFPKAKFILTLRNEEAWYKSITSFHAKLLTKGKAIPNMSDLQNSTYRYKGFLWDVNRAVWKTPENDVYNKEILIGNYNRHNEDVMTYFKDDPNFIAIDVSIKEDYGRLCSFLNKKPLSEAFPHLNKT